MSRPIGIHRLVTVALALTGCAAAWAGCSASNEQQTTGGGGSQTTTSSASGGDGGAGAQGGVDTDGGSTTTGGVCASTSAAAKPVPLDIAVLLDRSSSMAGPKWNGTVLALTKFFNDPASWKIGAGIAYFPNLKPDPCDPDGYKLLDVPIGTLPDNAFALTNSLPAEATGSPAGTPTHAALKGVLQVATAYQDTHPTHKVVVVLATDGDPNVCEPESIDAVAKLAESARNYNGVRTFVIGVAGSTIANLDKVAVAGGTTAAYDITSDIGEFAAAMQEIRAASLGCEFEIPEPPQGKEIDPDEINFAYTPGGIGDPKVLLRAEDLDDCLGKPGWYYNNKKAPTAIVLCPVSCATVQSDTKAVVDVLFGCESQVN